MFVAIDVLNVEGRSVIREPHSERRRILDPGARPAQDSCARLRDSRSRLRRRFNPNFAISVDCEGHPVNSALDDLGETAYADWVNRVEQGYVGSVSPRVLAVVVLEDEGCDYVGMLKVGEGLPGRPGRG